MFKKAVRKKVYIKIATIGPSGSGKTMGSIRLAKGLGGKVAVIDSENDSSSLYSHLDFDVCPITEPFTTKKYIQAIKAAEEAGYDVVVVDSISHAWAGSGGILDRKNIKDSVGGNSFQNWSVFTKEQNEFVQAVLSAKIHVICTMRSKVDYVMQENDKGKLAPKKVGLAPIQREGMDYEFSIVFDVSQSHISTISKDRTGLFDGQEFLLTEETGKQIKDFLESGAEVKALTVKEKTIELAQKVLDDVKREQILAAVVSTSDDTTLLAFQERIKAILNGA
jgi:hypothetical protein